MKTQGNTLLITGGASGIGLALAEAFTRAGNEVIVCARTEEHLQQVKQKLPGIHTYNCDVSKEDERKSLHDWVTDQFPAVNILVNNAGIQRMIDLTKGTEDLFRYQAIDGEDEIGVNLKAYVYLAAHFIPDFLQRSEAAIVNVSSGLAFIPLAVVPVYCATKAAIHSFSLSLRHQLKGTPIKVFEIIPPTVNTNLDKGARASRGQQDRGIPPADVAAAALQGIAQDDYEIAVGMAQNLRMGARSNPDQVFQSMNR